jgi:hypothetical protein
LQPVKNLDKGGSTKDLFNDVKFELVETMALKLEVQLGENNSAGIYGWSVKQDFLI